MQLIMFAKHMKSFDIATTAATARSWGLDGLDYPVRAGYAVNPDNFRTALPELVRALDGEGLALPMLTSEGDLIDPATPYVEPLMAAMNECGVRLLKIGYFRHEHGADYWRSVDEARAALERWATVAERHGVVVCCHTHSGPYVGLNASSLMHLIRGLDPGRIGAYLDTGHLTVSGEDFPMACAIVGEHLKVVGLKDMARVKENVEGTVAFGRKVFRPGRGATDLLGVLRHLASTGFRGPLTIHMEWSRDEAELLAGSAADAATYRRLLAEAEKAAAA